MLGVWKGKGPDSLRCYGYPYPGGFSRGMICVCGACCGAAVAVAEIEWSWDPSLYSGSAAYYSRGRVPYPNTVADCLAAALHLDGSGRLLDVGCGPGSLTLLLAPMFGEATGIDADPDMLREASRLAAEAGVRNVSWRLLLARGPSRRPGNLSADHLCAVVPLDEPTSGRRYSPRHAQ